MSTPTDGPPAAKTVRCAVYTRKSTDEGLDQEFNSLDAQRAAAAAYIASQQHEGWLCLPQRYDDGGYSGATLDRPALKRLLADVAAGQIDCVLTYKVDRLSRSLLDFAKIMECFDRQGVAFVSVTQQFHTATSMGRLILHVLLSFAQFERELIAERTRDKLAAARRRGRWAGGVPPLGYDVVPRSGRLRVNEEEAVRVRAIFALYLEHQAMLLVVRELDRRGWRTKCWRTRRGRQRGGRPFTAAHLYRLLSNVTYTGQVRYRHEVHPGTHPALVDLATWQQVQALLQGPPQRKGAPLLGGAWLGGLLRCAPCGCAMSGCQTTKGPRRYRYYVCRQAQKRGWQSCLGPSVPAGAIERLVVEQLQALAAPGAADVATRWAALPPAEQARVAGRLVERVDYDGARGTVAITFRADPAQVLAEELPPKEHHP
jgi:site-specific DNA recombinase